MTDPSRIRVLVVDDSVIARRFITRRLEKDEELEVVGTASSGSIALDKIARDEPDVVILDEEMPDMRGRDVLKVIRQDHPTVAVVMFSGHVSHGTQARFEALMLGADDAVAKPTSTGGQVGDDHPTWTELLTKAKHAARRPDRGGVSLDVARRADSGSRAQPRPASRPERGAGTAPRGPSRIAAAGSAVGLSARTQEAVAAAGPVTPTTSDPGVVVIASSTGGPDALTVLFSMLPADFPLPILIAQHMPPVFTKLLAQRLDKGSPITVREAQGDEVLEPGVAYIAPGDFHLVVRSKPFGCETELDLGPPENSCRPAADVLFRSAVAAFGKRTVGCVISGMGQDGMLGAIQVHGTGGRVIAQDEETSVVWGMPGAVVGAGVAHKVLPLEQIASELTMAARAVVTRGRRSGAAAEVRS